MDAEGLIKFAKSVSDARKTGNAGSAKTYFTAIYLGSQYPGITPPINDQTAINGYMLGRELSKRVK